MMNLRARYCVLVVLGACGSNPTPAPDTDRSAFALTTELLKNGGFEAGIPPAPWETWSSRPGATLVDNSGQAHGGSWRAWLLGYGSDSVDQLTQEIAIPDSALSAMLSFWLRVETDEVDEDVSD